MLGTAIVEKQGLKDTCLGDLEQALTSWTYPQKRHKMIAIRVLYINRQVKTPA